MSGSRLPALGPRGEGWTALQVVFMAGIALAAWWASRFDPHDDAGALEPVRLIGGILLLGGLALIVVGSVYLRRGKAFTALPRPIGGGTLVETGPYRLIRHPIYAGLIVAGVGVTLIRLSPVVGVLGVGLAVVLDLKRRREEAWLMERYPEYAAYRGRTKALIPLVY